MQIRKTSAGFPTLLPTPNTQLSTPITDFCNKVTFFFSRKWRVLMNMHLKVEYVVTWTLK